MGWMGGKVQIHTFKLRATLQNGSVTVQLKPQGWPNSGCHTQLVAVVL